MCEFQIGEVGFVMQKPSLSVGSSILTKPECAKRKKAR